MRRIFQYVFSLSCLTAALMSQNSLRAQEIVPLPGSEAASVQLPLFHSGWFGVTDGVLKGSAVAITKSGEEAVAAGAKVTLLETNGKARNATADDSGLFTFSGVQPGNYRLQVESETGFSSFAFRTVTMVGGESAVAKAYISTLSRAQAEEVFQAAWSPDLSTASGAPVSSKLVPQSLANQTPRVKMKDGLVYGELMFENASANPSNHVVKVFDADGGLITTERVDSLGKFSFAPKSAGVFNVVVGGFERACIPVIVVGQDGLSSLHNGTKFVGLNQPGAAADSLVIPVLGPDTPTPSDNPPIADGNDEAIIPLGLPPGIPVGPGGGFAGGGFSGGGVGGGGAGGGGGGFGGGGALGLAGIALGAVALADDDGFNANAASLIAP